MIHDSSSKAAGEPAADRAVHWEAPAMWRRLDRCDRLLLFLLAVVLGAGTVLLLRYPAATPSRRHIQAQQVQSPELAAKLRVAANFIAAANPAEAEKVVAELLAAHPYNGQVHMLAGDLRLLAQDPLGAVAEYRKAVDLDPDFLDRKAKKFQGKKIKNALEEMWQRLQAGGLAPPAEDDYRRLYYYMQRKLAGSCG